MRVKSEKKIYDIIRQNTFYTQIIYQENIKWLLITVKFRKF